MLNKREIPRSHVDISGEQRLVHTMMDGQIYMKPQNYLARQQLHESTLNDC